MKILHIAYSCIPHEFRGGVAKVVYELACAQANLGHQVTVFATNYNSAVSLDVPLFSSLQQNGIEIRYFPATRATWFRSPAMQQELQRIASQYDILHSHNTFLALNVYAAEAHRIHNVPLYFHVHGALDPVVVNRGFFKSLRKHIYIRLYEQRNYTHATGLLALSNAEAKQIRYYGIKTPIHVVPNGISFPENGNKVDATSFRAKHQLSTEHNIILYVGRINPKKGIHLLLHAFAELHKALPHTILLIAGDPDEDISYTAELHQIINDKNIGSNVVWTGFLDEKMKQQAFAVADIFSHVSASEGMAMAILEAMAAGLPTIVSKACNMDEAVQAQALIESTFEVNTLRIQLEQLLLDDQQRQRVGQTAYQYVRKYHNWHTIAQQVVQIYSSSTKL